MTAPGLAMFYGGLVRKKNVLGVMMQCIFLMGLMTVIWALYGYSLAFGAADNEYIGSANHVLMRGLQTTWEGEGDAGQQSATPMFTLKDAAGNDYDVFPCSRTCCFRACSSSSRRR